MKMAKHKWLAGLLAGTMLVSMLPVAGAVDAGYTPEKIAWNASTSNWEIDGEAKHVAFAPLLTFRNLGCKAQTSERSIKFGLSNNNVHEVECLYTEWDNSNPIVATFENGQASLTINDTCPVADEGGNFENREYATIGEISVVKVLVARTNKAGVAECVGIALNDFTVNDVSVDCSNLQVKNENADKSYNEYIISLSEPVPADSELKIEATIAIDGVSTVNNVGDNAKIAFAIGKEYTYSGETENEESFYLSEAEFEAMDDFSEVAYLKDTNGEYHVFDGMDLANTTEVAGNAKVHIHTDACDLKPEVDDENKTTTTTVPTLGTSAEKDTTITATTGDDGEVDTEIKEAAVTIPQAATEALAEAKSTTIKTDVATVTFPQVAMETVKEATDANGVKLEVKKVEKTEVDSTIQNSIPDDALVVDLNLYKLDSNDDALENSKITEFGTDIEVTIPYQSEPGKIPAVYYIADDGSVKSMQVTGSTDTTVTFLTNHFSVYAAVAVTPDDDRRAPTVDFEISIEGNGDISPNGGDDGIISVTSGSNKTFTITKGDVDTVLFNGDEIDVEDGKFTIKDIGKGDELEVIFSGEAVEEEPEEVTTPYADLSADDYGFDAICNVSALGIMNGYTDGTFRADTTLSRAMVAEMLYRMAGSPAVGASTFSDVPAGQWYTNGVAWAAANSLVEGYTDGTFLPDQAVTRQELAVILYRVAQASELGYTGNWMFLLDVADCASIADWAYEGVCWCNQNGLLPANQDNTLAPTAPATRADVAVAFDALLAILAQLA